MLGKMPEVYEGDLPYIFVSYAHADRDAVLPMITALVAEGYRVWYDDSIELAEDYPDYIADHVYGCSCFVMFVSPSALSSKWCKKEANYAIELDKRILPVYLEDVELTRGLQMGMGGKQALYWYKYDSDEVFYRKLFKARRLESCLTPEGRERRGVKARGGGAKAAPEAQAAGPVSDESQADERRNDEAGPTNPQPAGRRADRFGKATLEDVVPRDGRAVATAPQASDSQVSELKAAPTGVRKNKGSTTGGNRRSDDETQPHGRRHDQQNAKGGVSSGGAERMGVGGERPRKNSDPAPREHFADGEANDAARLHAVNKADDAVGAHVTNGTGSARSAASGDKGAEARVGGPASPVKPVVDNGVRGRSSLIVAKGSLAAYSWAELKEISRLIAAAGSDVTGLAIARRYNLVDKDGRLRGDEKHKKPLALVDGTKTSVRILGFRHDELAAGGKAGISFEFADVPAMHRMNGEWTNKGGWKASEMRRWLNDDNEGFLALLPDDLRSCVAPAAKRTNNRGGVMRENDTSPVTATTDTLWLLSVSEVYGRLSEQRENVPRSPATYDAEGTQYQLYADKGVTTSSFGPCKKDGAFSWWWLRSPDAHNSYGFHGVYNLGAWDAHHADRDWGVSPGFCF